jgi:hypothetical protein
MTEQRKVNITEFLSEAEIERCVALYRQLHGSGTFAAAVSKEITKPNLARINAALGQENDPDFLAYAIEYVIMQATLRSAHPPLCECCGKPVAECEAEKNDIWEHNQFPE